MSVLIRGLLEYSMIIIDRDKDINSPIRRKSLIRSPEPVYSHS
jgi:hypothetical protein